MLKRVLILLSIIFVFTAFNNPDDQSNEEVKTEPAFLQVQNNWVDSVFQSLSNEERIAQLFIISAYSNKTQEHINEISAMVKNYNVGGLIFFQGGPFRQTELVNYYQGIAKTPLFIGQDAEWGIGMRLDSVLDFPRQMMLGAIQNDSLIYAFGKEVAMQCKKVGVHINFAPVVDINNNPMNPVIGSRAFGEDKENVMRKSLMYAKGMEENGILTSAKHFPGHGDTDVDSHYALPVIKHKKRRIQHLELYPYKKLIEKGLTGIMVAHLNIPSLQKDKKRASTLSPEIVHDLLIKKMGFQGLIYTDALNMKGVTNHYPPGRIEIEAIKAGNDVLLFPVNVAVGIDSIKAAIQRGEITMQRINQSCKKILKAKYWAGLNGFEAIDNASIADRMNTEESQQLKRTLVENALTLVENKNMVPIERLDTLAIASVSIGASEITEFQKTLKLYAQVDDYQIARDAPLDDFALLKEKLSSYNLIIVGLHDTNEHPKKKYGITKVSLEFMAQLSSEKNVIFNLFANPYSLKYFEHIFPESIIMAYEDDDVIQDLSAQLIFGGIPSLGKLPVTASERFPINKGIVQKKKIRLKYGLPIEVGMNSDSLFVVDSIIGHAIREKATPGSQILCAKNGVVFYQKAFGYHTYDSVKKVKLDDIYDIASITKIAATTIALMKLYDDQLFDPESRLSDIICDLDTTDKRDLYVKDVLAHQSGLKAWIPFYRKTIENDSIYRTLYASEQSDSFSIRIHDSLYLFSNYKDSIYKAILDTTLRETNDYLYSDLGFYLLKNGIELLTQRTFSTFVDSIFYHPLGCNTLGFNAKDYYPVSKIVPSEFDTVFRKTIVQGYVHDPGAAMLGGVSGHAGLFSNANDLAKLGQMLLNKGWYGSTEYLQSETVDYFTSCEVCDKNRRALGFDKPELDQEKEGPVFKGISGKSFGHSGFTGTLLWVDPDQKMVYVFLSNRTFPDASNNRLVKENIRTEIMKAFYRADTTTKNML